MNEIIENLFVQMAQNQILYGPAPIPVHRNYWLAVVEWVVGVLLVVLAMFFIWKKFIRKKDVKKDIEGGETKS